MNTTVSQDFANAADRATDGVLSVHDTLAIQDKLARDYGGVQATGGMVNADYHSQFDPNVRVEWTDPRLKRITRLRLLSDIGYPLWDIHYCHGELIDGTKVDVDLPMRDLPRSRNGKAMWAALYKAGDKDGVRVNRLFAGCDIATLL